MQRRARATAPTFSAFLGRTRTVRMRQPFGIMTSASSESHGVGVSEI